jgi:streptogrisin C
MDRRRILAASVVFVTLGAAAAITVPALATTGEDERTTAANKAEPELLAALQRDLSLSADQAQRRLDSERTATRTLAELRQDVSAAYAGGWLNKDSGQLMVAVTDSALADEVRAAGAEPKVVERSATELDSLKQSLDRRAAVASPELPGWYIDVATNSVVVLANDGAEAAAREFAGDAPGVRVVSTDEAPVPLFDVRGGDPFFIGNGRCSVGFSVEGGFVTAGHCGQVGDDTTGFNQEAQGTFSASSFPGDDFGVVRVNGDWTPRPVVNDFNGGEVVVAGSEEAPVGASICRSGSTTGTRCGVIQAKNATVNYPEGTVTGLTRTNVCAEPGDSGGSWMSGDQAQGVTSGGSGNCTVGGTTFFQPLNEILQRNGLTLVTSANGGGGGEAPPPATEAPEPEEPAEPPAGQCADMENVMTGSLNRTGSRAVQPNGRFFRLTGTARLTACLDGPAGADFDLYLQRWNGRSFQTVARATGPGSDEQIVVNASAGAYRYRVESDSGSGAYTLGISTS